ncbi:adipocyte plasma membrane-associated protein-like [Tropilaelaps mercedesae]|uniref:Adipocyte plasma membrane-associated protein-like n=1 Tax=Tropilaelaps mercedesae TaxID=418985 RepID=A0A1V9XM88_9ACAR|nr:adipocyte plasma membrane-associated protein-like [Tropilaelaps mercedesae]
MWYLWKLQIQVALASLLAFFLLPFAPIPLDFHPVAYNVTLPEFTGRLTINKDLHRAKMLFQQKLNGPESLAIKDGMIYTGTQLGDVYRIDPIKETLTKVTNTGSDCEGLFEEEKCGRVLGLRFAPNGDLYAADAYKGLLKIDINTGKVETLVANGEYVGTSKLLFPNDLDIDDNGIIYYSQASTRWGLHQLTYIVMEHDTTGRILTYDTKTKKSGILQDNLAFPNGVQISDDRTALLFSELANKRILKYQLKGADKGKLTEFTTSLPGGPDNLRLNEHGTYWVAIDGARSVTLPHISDLIAPYPLIAKATMRFCWLVGEGLERVNSYLNNPTIKATSADFKNGKVLLKLLPERGIVVEVIETGEILRGLHSTNFTFFSEVLEHEGYLYIGSFIAPYLLRVPNPPFLGD